jgi:hypothetical protein
LSAELAAPAENAAQQKPIFFIMLAGKGFGVRESVRLCRAQSGSPKKKDSRADRRRLGKENVKFPRQLQRACR